MNKRKLLNAVNMLVFAGILLVPNTIRTKNTPPAKVIKNIVGKITLFAGNALLIFSSFLTGYTLSREECFFRGDLWQGLRSWFNSPISYPLSTVIQRSYPGQLLALAAIGITTGFILHEIGTALKSHPKYSKEIACIYNG